MDELKSSVDRPYRLGIGDRLWETALQNYADPSVQKKIRENGGLTSRRTGRTSADMSRNLDIVSENIIFFLVREAAKYLYETRSDRISAKDIASLLTTDRFSIGENTIRRHLTGKYPFLIEYYSLFVQTLENINKRYGEVILELWQAGRRKPTTVEIAKRLHASASAVRTKLEGANRSSNPAWLIQLYERGPVDKPPPESA